MGYCTVHSLYSTTNMLGLVSDSSEAEYHSGLSVSLPPGFQQY
jgi:hypothetical protein